MNTFWSTVLVILIVFPLVFFVKHILNSCPFRKHHDWVYAGTEIIHEGFKSVKYKKYVCKNCGKVEKMICNL